ncbi:hypothetical protein R0K04_12750 [Pseudoalteromonas sp. SIMBA_153]
MESIFPESDEPKAYERSPQGMIKYHRLQKWWLEELTFSERKRCRIEYAYDPMSTGNIDKGLYSKSSSSTVNFLKSLASHFSSKEGDRPLALKILKEAEANIYLSTSVVDQHFLYGRMMELYYKDRNKEGYYDLAKEYALKQIKIAKKAITQMKRQHEKLARDRIHKYKSYRNHTMADFPFHLPSHAGYKQLAVIYKKEKCWNDVIVLCEQAIEQGWNGNWEERVDDALRQKLKQKAP